MDIAELKKLAGIPEYTGQHPVTSVDINISHTATALKQKERELGLKPGDQEWFKLWFGLPKMTGMNMPKGFRGRKK